MPGKKGATHEKHQTDAPPAERMDFAALVTAIQQVHEHCAAQVNRAVNASLTLRNWVIGGYIHHYELHGRDRATYGEGLVDRLASELAEQEVTACDRQRLYSYLAFFRAYPQVGDAIPSGALPHWRQDCNRARRPLSGRRPEHQAPVPESRLSGQRPDISPWRARCSWSGFPTRISNC